MEEILKLNNLWRENSSKNLDNLKLNIELSALDRMLVAGKIFKFIVVGVYSNSQLICFCINEIISEESAISHYAKADTSSSGVYDFLMRENAKILKEKGIKYINYEQDLGIASLRHAKLSFRPIEFLKKYSVTLK